MKIGDTFVHGIYAGVDASQNYDNNGNWAETVGRLMHFSGKDGAVQIAEKNISNLEKQFGANGSQKILDFFDSEGINTQEEIDEFNNIYTATEQAKKGIYDADVAIQEWTKHKKESIESTSSLSDYFSKDQEYLEYISQLGKVGKIDEDSIQSLKDYDKLLEMCGGDAKKLVEELQKISKESNGTNGSIEAANNLATTDKGYKALNEAYQQAMQNGFVDSTTISSLYDQFGDLDVFDKFVEAMQNIGNAAYDTQAAFDSLSNSYARSNIDLNDLTDATAKQYETELTRQGVENAEQAISERLAYMNGIRAQALEELHNANITTITSTDALNNATTDEINATATRSATKNVNQLAGSANYGINTAKKGSKKYNTALSNIKGYIKKRVVIPSSLLAIVAKNNPTLYNRLYMYNLGIENLKTAREEYITAYSANSAEKYNNIADKYKNLDDATNDAMDLYNSKSSNSVYAKNKNSYLDKQKSGYCWTK